MVVYETVDALTRLNNEIRTSPTSARLILSSDGYACVLEAQTVVDVSESKCLLNLDSVLERLVEFLRYVNPCL